MFQLQCLLDYKYSFNVNVNVCLILFSFQVKWVDSQKKKRKNLKLLFWSKIFRKQKKLHKKGILLHLHYITFSSDMMLTVKCHFQY